MRYTIERDKPIIIGVPDSVECDLELRCHPMLGLCESNMGVHSEKVTLFHLKKHPGETKCCRVF